MIVAKQGEYGAALITRDELLRAAGLSAGDRDRPDRRRRHVRRRLRRLHRRATSQEALSDELLRRAMAHATVLASFNVEEFGTERVQRLTRAGDRRAHRRAARDDAVQRRALTLPTSAPGDRPRRAVRGCTDPPPGIRSGRSGHVDLHLADVPPEDPDRGAVPDRALGRAPDAARPRDAARTAASGRARVRCTPTTPARGARARRGAGRTASLRAPSPPRVRTVASHKRLPHALSRQARPLAPARSHA